MLMEYVYVEERKSFGKFSKLSRILNFPRFFGKFQEMYHPFATLPRIHDCFWMIIIGEKNSL